MIEFSCVCHHVFIVGKKKVFGPVDAYSAKMMTREEFREDFSDCEQVYTKGKEQ